MRHFILITLGLMACSNEPTLGLGSPCSELGIAALERASRNAVVVDEGCDGELCVRFTPTECGVAGEPCSRGEPVTYCTYGCASLSGATPCDDGYTCVSSIDGVFHCEDNRYMDNIEAVDGGL